MLNVADVAKSLASAAKVRQAGNRIILDPETGESFIEKISTGKHMGLKIHKGTYVFEGQVIGRRRDGLHHFGQWRRSVLPKKIQRELEMLPKKAGLKIVLANNIDNFS